MCNFKSKNDVRDHLTEIPLFRWVIAACRCYKLFDRGRLAVALHYAEFQAIFPSPEISMTQCASFPLLDRTSLAKTYFLVSFYCVFLFSNRITCILCRLRRHSVSYTVSEKYKMLLASFPDMVYYNIYLMLRVIYFL